MWRTFGVFLVLYVLTTIFTLAAVPERDAQLRTSTRGPGSSWCSTCWPSPTSRGRSTSGRPGYAFLSSCCTIAAFIFLFSIALTPNLVASSIKPEYSLTIYNAASSAKTLAHHADHRDHRHALRAGLHRRHLLGLPRQGRRSASTATESCAARRNSC